MRLKRLSVPVQKVGAERRVSHRGWPRAPEREGGHPPYQQPLRPRGSSQRR